MVFAAHDGHDSHTLYSSHWFRIHQGTRTMKRSQCCSRSFSASGSSPWSSIFAIDSAIASYLWRNNTITNNNTTTTLSGNYKEWPQRKPMPMPCFEQTWYNTVIPYHIISSKHPNQIFHFFQDLWHLDIISTEKYFFCSGVCFPSSAFNHPGANEKHPGSWTKEIIEK